jgi:flagellar hook-length control protein FliK
MGVRAGTNSVPSASIGAKSDDLKKNRLEQDLNTSSPNQFVSTQPPLTPVVGQAVGQAMDGFVTTGAAGKTILSHDAVHQLGQQLNLISQTQKDGEIRIRLKPDHLGELQMRVRADGQNISIQISADDSRAKSIIEESMSSLKDTLAQHQLNLTSVDVSKMDATRSDPTRFDGSANLNLNMNQNGNGQQAQERQGRESSQGFERGNGQQSSGMIRSITQNMAPQVNRAESGRLDMIA